MKDFGFVWKEEGGSQLTEDADNFSFTASATQVFRLLPSDLATLAAREWSSGGILRISLPEAGTSGVLPIRPQKAR